MPARASRPMAAAPRRGVGAVALRRRPPVGEGRLSGENPARFGRFNMAGNSVEDSGWLAPARLCEGAMRRRRHATSLIDGRAKREAAPIPSEDKNHPGSGLAAGSPSDPGGATRTRPAHDEEKSSILVAGWDQRHGSLGRLRLQGGFAMNVDRLAPATAMWRREGPYCQAPSTRRATRCEVADRVDRARRGWVARRSA